MVQKEETGEDVERADPPRRVSEAPSRRISRASIKEDWGSLDEYGKLVKYVSTYREGREEDEGDEEEVMRRVWYAPWKKRKLRVKKTDQEPGQFPDDWRITDIREGLSSSEVPNRRRRSGWNELVSEKENPIAKILSYFRGPILYGELSLLRCVECIVSDSSIVMELAVLLAGGLEDWVDFGVIIGILCLNAAVGWYQEKQAADVVASLKGDIAMRALVIRDSQEQEILARELVPGDVVC